MSDTTEVARPATRRSQLLLFRAEDGTSADNKNVNSSTTPAAGVHTVGATALATRVIPIDRLYEAPKGETYNIVRAIELLREVSASHNEARHAKSAIEMDQYVQRVQLALPRLFALRSISEGFGLVINSLNIAFVNRRGVPLTEEQLIVVWRVLRELRARPVISLDQGIQQVEQLEEQGLQVDPIEIGELLEPDSPANV